MRRRNAGSSGTVLLALTPAQVDGVPGVVRLLPKGSVRSRKGDFVVDDESFRLMNEQFLGRKLDLVIDYEHQTLKDVQAPAAGWIKELVNGDDAILAKVEWTSRAQEYLKNREYRYLSPVILKRETDKKVVALHSAALTNTPAIDGMFPVVNSLGPEDYREETKMELKKLIELLGLSPEATEADVEAAIRSAMERKAETGSQTAEANKAAPAADGTILELLGLKEDAKTAEVAAAIMALKQGDAGLAAQVQALKDQIAGRNADEAVAAALKAGKVTAAQKDWAKGYALKDPEGFAAFVAAAPAAVPMGRLSDPAETGSRKAGRYDMAVLKNLGLTEEEIEKYCKEEA